MKIGVPKEIIDGEARVALTPSLVAPLINDGHSVIVQHDAGILASFSNDQYSAAGAKVVATASDLFAAANIILKVQPPTKLEADQFSKESTYVGFLAPLTNADLLRVFVERRVTGFSMEFIPRITRAQSMDVLSSMSTVTGYKSVLLAADRIGKMFPLLMTAAGTVPPATVLILGAGVAGLQAIATAKRLGAKVEAFDPRPAVREQVKSLGAMFIEMELPEDAETEGGYAKELSPEFIKKEMEAIASRLPKVDVVICTAQVFGKRAPILLTADMVKLMRHGSVIVDLAAEQGGNCELTKAGVTVEHAGVSIIGTVNLAATVPVDASQMYARNVINFLRHLYPKGASPDFNDEIIKGACITRNGEITNELVRIALGQGGRK